MLYPAPLSAHRPVHLPLVMTRPRFDAPREVEITDFCARVRYLIDRYDEGNVTAASRRIGIPQRTLHKIYTGSVQEPRLVAVQKILGGYKGEDPSWVLLGAFRAEATKLEALAADQAKRILRRAVEQMSDAPMGGITDADRPHGVTRLRKQRKTG